MQNRNVTQDIVGNIMSIETKIYMFNKTFESIQMSLPKALKHGTLYTEKHQLVDDYFPAHAWFTILLMMKIYIFDFVIIFQFLYNTNVYL